MMGIKLIDMFDNHKKTPSIKNLVDQIASSIQLLASDIHTKRGIGIHVS
jgi:hypothetical protein